MRNGFPSSAAFHPRRTESLIFTASDAVLLSKYSLTDGRKAVPLIMPHSEVVANLLNAF